MICDSCGATMPQTRFRPICKCGEGREVVCLRPVDDSHICIHRGDSVGTANCGCQGKYNVHWCNLLQGHCTPQTPGKTWLTVETPDGKIDRVGRLKPCLHCKHRSTHIAQKLLSSTLPKWHYITNTQLATDATIFASKLPPLAGVAGIPVSGMLVAPFISTLLHIPLYEASTQHGLRPVGHGFRGSTRQVDERLPVLIIDDTSNSGGAIKGVKAKLDQGNYLFATLYANPRALPTLDYYGTELDEPHLLEWNIANTGYLRSLSPRATFDGSGVAIDFDGVLCPNPPKVFDEVNERQAYLDWLANAPLGKFVPRMYPVPDIISYRCEYTRQTTEAWLAKHGIRYDRLHLWPGEPDSRNWNAAAWKGKFYAENKHGLFIESCERQARDIAQFSGKKVLCLDNGVVY